MKNLLVKIKEELKSKYARNVLTIFSGTSISQIIPFFISPLLTRLFEPSDFGLLALFTTIALLFANISTFQYESAIMLPRDNKDAFSLLALSTIITVLLSLFLLVVFILFNKIIINILGDKEISTWLYFIPLSVLLQGLFRSFNMYASRLTMFKDVAYRNIIQTSSTAGSKLLFGVLKYTNGTLILGTLIGQFIATSYIVFKPLKKTEIGFEQIKFSEIKRNAIVYKDFPKYRSWLGFINMLNETSVRLIISNFYNTTILGLFSFTIGLMQRPNELIGKSISQVYFQKSAEIVARKNPNGWELLKKTLIYLIASGIIIYSPFIFWGEEIFGFVFGIQWGTAGLYVKYLTPWLFIKFVFTPISSIPMVYNKQKEELYYRIGFNLIIPAVYFSVGYHSVDFTVALLISSFIAFIYLGAMIFWFKNLVKS